MSSENRIENRSDSSEPKPAAAESTGKPEVQDEFPYYIVPAPPIPGKTAWSLAPW
jgi:hypothetical protein